MLNILVDELSPEDIPWLTVKFSKRLVSCTQDAKGVQMHFTDDTNSRADILIGADGTDSSTHQTIYSDLAEKARYTESQKAEGLLGYISLSWSGTYAYRALLDRGKLQASSPNNMILRGPTIVLEFGRGAPNIRRSTAADGHLRC